MIKFTAGERKALLVTIESLIQAKERNGCELLTIAITLPEFKALKEKIITNKIDLNDIALLQKAIKMPYTRPDYYGNATALEIGHWVKAVAKLDCGFTMDFAW